LENPPAKQFSAAFFIWLRIREEIKPIVSCGGLRLFLLIPPYMLLSGNDVRPAFFFDYRTTENFAEGEAFPALHF
jgi:hypothetical protein